MERRVDASCTVFRGTLGGDGRPGPIEQRMGRRLVRLIDPESAEGAAILASGRVTMIGPDGDLMGTLTLAEAHRRIRERLERNLQDQNADI